MTGSISKPLGWDPRNLARVAAVEGWLALPLVVLATVVNPLLAWVPRGAMPFALAAFLACAWLCALSGVRHARGVPRALAGLALAALLFHAGLIVYSRLPA